MSTVLSVLICQDRSCSKKVYINTSVLTKQDLQGLNKYPHLECHVQNLQVGKDCSRERKHTCMTDVMEITHNGVIFKNSNFQLHETKAGNPSVSAGYTYFLLRSWLKCLRLWQTCITCFALVQIILIPATMRVIIGNPMGGWFILRNNPFGTH